MRGSGAMARVTAGLRQCRIIGNALLLGASLLGTPIVVDPSLIKRERSPPTS